MQQQPVMLKYMPLGIAFLLLCPLPLPAGNSGKTTVQATVGTSPRAEDTSQFMIQTAVVPAKTDDKPMAPPPPRCAADWVAAWQAAKEVCPEGAVMKVYYSDRSGSRPEALKAFECVGLKARGELLVLTCKSPGQKEESAAIIRAGDVVRIEVGKPAPASP